MLPSWCSQTITIIRPGTKTSRGSTIPDWETPISSTDVAGCSVQPAGTSLSEDGRVLGITDGYTAYVPPGTDVLAGDHIVFEGETTEIAQIENGKLKIDNSVYDLQGRRVNGQWSMVNRQLKKGVYVKDGRKVVK
jgi:hypothetical protein